MTESNNWFQSERGLFRHQGANHPLNVNSFKVDDRKIYDLILYLEKVSKYVRYYDKSNKVDGDWRFFFENDVLYDLSRIVSIKLNDVEKEWKVLSQRLDYTSLVKEQVDVITQVLGFIDNLFFQLDQWFVGSLKVGDPMEEELNQYLYNLITQNLNYDFKKFIKIAEKFTKADIYRIKHSYNDVFFQGDNVDLVFEEEVSLYVHLESYKDIFNLLNIIFNNIYQHLNQLLVFSNGLLLESLYENRTHNPDFALLVAFLESYQTIQKRLNSFTESHLDYFFSEILKQNRIGAIPDKVNFYLELNDDSSELLLTKGSIVEAGSTPSGEDVFYSLDHDVYVNNIQISKVCISNVASNPNYTNLDHYSFVTGIYSSQLDDFNELEYNGKPLELFGRDQIDLLDQYKSMDESDVGFELCSSVLYLSSGRRVINIRFFINQDSFLSFVEVLKSYSNSEKIGMDASFDAMMSESLELKITTENGWKRVEKYKIIPPKDWLQTYFDIYVELDYSFSSITALEGSKAPKISFLARRNKISYSYSLFKDFIVDAIEIAVEVENMANPNIYNELGKVDTSQVFYPFGATPKKGSYFLFGHPEFVCKNLTDLSFEMEWQNLPKNGFEEHYKEYEIGINNDSFQCTISYLNDYKFFPFSERQTFKIFEGEGANINSHLSVDSVDLNKFPISKDENSFAQAEEYSSDTKKGYFKVELSSPDDGFGSEVFSNIYAESAMNQAKTSFLNFGKPNSQKDIKYPKQPFIPSLKSFNVSYQAYEKIELRKNLHEKSIMDESNLFKHIYPFGELVIYDKKCLNKPFMMPQFKADGYLNLGLTNTELANHLYLYFEVFQDNNEVTNGELSFQWTYLANDVWHHFSKDMLLLDTTNSFLNSGVIALRLPDDWTMNNTLMPPDLYWISLSVRGKGVFPKFKLLKTQGLSAVWHNDNEEVEWKTSISEDSITKFADAYPEISSVSQPFPSYEGKLKEAKGEFYRRLSERLHHKNRLITKYDFKTYILNSFQNVRCVFGYNTKTSLKMILVPYTTTDEYYLPFFDNLFLKSVSKSIIAYKANNIDLSVENPSYELIQLRFKVKFDDSQRNGYYLSKMKREIFSFLTPWFFDKHAEILLNRKISFESIINFLNSRKYIKHITSLSVIHLVKDGDGYIKFDSVESMSNEIRAINPESLLVSALDHDVEIIDQEVLISPEKSSLDKMRIGADFIVSGGDDSEEEIGNGDGVDDGVSKISFKI